MVAEIWASVISPFVDQWVALRGITNIKMVERQHKSRLMFGFSRTFHKIPVFSRPGILIYQGVLSKSSRRMFILTGCFWSGDLQLRPSK